MNEAIGRGVMAHEQRSKEFEERFRQTIENMTTGKLTPLSRVGYALGAIMGLCFAGFFGYVAWTAPSEFPMLGRLTFVAGAIFGGLWAGLCAYVVRKGSFSLEPDESTMHGLTWGFMVLMMTAFLIIGGRMEDRVLGISMVLNGLVFYVAFAIPAFVSMRVNRLELRVREQLLMMEIRMTEMAEKQGTPAAGS